ncbi:MAG: twin-arginine translocase subunit TatC [Nocardioides sp.]
MSISGVVGLFVGKPQHPIGPDGRMALSDHFRELRARIMISGTAIVVVLIASLFYFDQLYQLFLRPYDKGVAALDEDIDIKLTVAGLGGPLLLRLKLSGVAAIIVTSPIWLYQIWAFILPGLHAGERKWSRVFASIAGPLFLLGAALGYVTLPKAIEVLAGFTPDGSTNLIENGSYVTFFVRTLLVFGIAFEIPVFVILLNLAGIVSGKALGEHRSWIVVGTFIFAAIATPSVEPYSMLLLAIPMVLLFGISEVIARLIDRRRAKADILAGLSDDETSEIEELSSIDEDHPL